MRLEQSIVLKVPREALWPLVSDTDRLNREVGLPPVKYEHKPLPGGGTETRAGTSKFKVAIEWREFPFEWSAPYFYHVEREFYAGPLKHFKGGTELIDKGGSTEVKFWAEFEASNLFTRILAKRAMADGLKGSIDLFQRYETFLLKRERRVSTRRMAPNVNDPILLEGGRALVAEGFPEVLVEKFTSHLRSAPVEEVRLMKPYGLADRWQEDRRRVLEMFLEGTKAGLVELRWTIVCPSCCGAKQDSDHLHSIRREGSCDACSIGFDNEFDKTVEARFDAHPAIRAAGRDKYCAGGPGNTPHLSAQFRLPPDSRRRVLVRLAAGHYTVRSPQSHARAELQIDPRHAARAEIEVEIGEDGIVAGAGQAAPGEIALSIANTISREALIQVQINDWDAQSVSAAEITTIQKFRDLFADEAIEAGQEMSIGRLAFLFSDLEGSTALYEQVGDVPAFALIRSHFKFMKERVEKCRGAVVKTMGDAVMAVFANPKDALQAAAEVQKDAVALLNKSGADAKFRIKVGLHAGPCVVVGTNGIVDYFGTTVNLAQRTQAAAHCGDVMMCESFYNEINGREILDGGWEIKREDLMLRGFQNPITLLRCHPK